MGGRLSVSNSTSTTAPMTVFTDPTAPFTSVAYVRAAVLREMDRKVEDGKYVFKIK
jgi:hypothetical protein